MNKVFLRQLVKCFGFLAETLPEKYKPAARAFLFSLSNETPDYERPVPQEIFPTLALAVLIAIFDRVLPSELDYFWAVEELDQHNKPVAVRRCHYPYYGEATITGYELDHPHYFVLGGFTATPVGDGLWLIEDRYDWHFPDYWRVPDIIASKVPDWVLSKLCEKGEDGGWYVSEVDTLSKWSTPYWHRSVVKLSEYLDLKWFE